MPAPRLLTPQCIRPVWTLSNSPRTQCLNNSTVSPRQRGRQPRPRKLSLFEELFPEESQKIRDRCSDVEDKDYDIPRLPLPEIDEFFAGLSDDPDHSSLRPDEVASTAAADAFRQQKLAVLALQVASKSLVESDFRRIAPRGRHISHWTGPGDILKVIPARDPQTMEAAGYYYILFTNPAYARAYQGHVLHLHRVAKTYTPTSVESPLPLQRGVVIEGEDAYAILQDYGLCPPSHNMQLKLLYPSYSPSTKRLLDQRGYRQLVERNDKTGRSVLFWVDGQQLTTSVIKNTIAADGRERGLAWEFLVEKVDTSAATTDDIVDSKNLEYDGGAELRPQQSAPLRWVLSFTDENEARRFIRAWHRRPFPMARGDSPRLVHAEFVW